MAGVVKFLRDAVMTWTSNTLNEADKVSIMRILRAVKRDYYSVFSVPERILVSALEFLRARDELGRLGLTDDLVTRVNDRDHYDAVFEEVVSICDSPSSRFPLAVAIPEAPKARQLPPYIEIPSKGESLKFSREMINDLKEGVEKYGTQWETIRSKYDTLKIFTGTQLKDRYRRL